MIDMNGLKVHLLSASYKRAGIVSTHLLMPEVVYCVDGSEREEYEGVHDKVMVLPDGVQGRLARVWNWLLDKYEGENVLFIDDDIEWIGGWVGNVHKRLDWDGIKRLIYNGFKMSEDVEVHYWGLNCIQDKGAYREYTPFNFIAYIGGPWQGHRKSPIRYDEEMVLKEDYDLSLQHLNKFRKVLRFNAFHYKSKQHTIRGGCSAYRTVEREMEQNRKLIKKWGGKIVRLDDGKSQVGRKKGAAHADINPIIKPPIRGV